jgi:hypothetical protein
MVPLGRIVAGHSRFDYIMKTEFQALMFAKPAECVGFGRPGIQNRQNMGDAGVGMPGQFVNSADGGFEWTGHRVSAYAPDRPADICVDIQDQR